MMLFKGDIVEVTQIVEGKWSNIHNSLDSPNFIFFLPSPHMWSAW
jgi:hypothetical protein